MYITINPLGESRYQVNIQEGSSRSQHEVVVTGSHLSRYAAPGVTAEALLKASFEFLLERESKESILSHFDLAVIERYFPDYPKRIREQLQR
jgi:hypothetical protein